MHVPHHYVDGVIPEQPEFKKGEFAICQKVREQVVFIV
jgi:hypothetical protein